jgi:hypothetical protein
MAEPQAVAQDDARQRRPHELRLLLSPGLSERLARRSTDEWSSSKPGTRSVRCEMLTWIAKQAPSGPWHPRRPTADDTARVRVDRPNGDTSNKRPVALKGQKFVRILPERDYTQRLKKANPS